MGDWPPNNMGVKMQNAVRDMVDTCNDSGSISLNEDGSPKQFICPNTYYDSSNDAQCWKSINADGNDDGSGDQCVSNVQNLDCDPNALNVGSMLKSPECAKAYSKASIMHGERTSDGITWEHECGDADNEKCHLFPNPNMRIGASDGSGRPNVNGTHPLLTDTPTELYNDKRKTMCSQLSNSGGVLSRHKRFWEGADRSPAAAMAGNCSATETADGGCITGYSKIKSILKDETNKAMITNSALVGMYQGLDCGVLDPIPALCQVHPDGTNANCAIPSNLEVSPSKYKEGCGKQCQQEIEALLARLKISSQNVYFYLKLVMKYEGAYSKDNEFGKKYLNPTSGGLADISTIIGEPGGANEIIKRYFKSIMTHAESRLGGDISLSSVPITDSFGLLFKDPRTAKYLRLAGRNYLEISLIEKKIMAIYMYTHKSLNDRMNAIKSEIKKIVQSNQDELDRLRENAHTKVRGISKRQVSMEGGRSGVVTVRIAIVIIMLILTVLGTVPAAGRTLTQMVDMVRRK
jgi:hypothetical protein